MKSTNSTNPAIPAFAVIGHPIAHSRSPSVHAAFGKQTGIALTYDRLDVKPENFVTDVTAFFAQGGRGMNVTVPHKEAAYELSKQHLSPRAQDAAAVNTLWMEEGQIHGCNTDGVGLVMDLERQHMLGPDQRILLLGAGGAARGVLGPLLDTGCALICIANRTLARAETLRDDWVKRHPDDLARLQVCTLDDDQLNQPWDLIINATSTSLGAQTLVLPEQAITTHTAVYDMMYGSELSAFLKDSQQRQARLVSDGLGMLVCQAAESFRIWNGATPQVEPVIAHIRAELSGRVG
ncbi:shikimate dehydrogenase [Orrella sp. 11846]|uniref:shikimate dehydrogenase n=1 Tax=Orrella sp. 11846 TaxID=3409913 RepID=UPI003B59CFB1